MEKKTYSNLVVSSAPHIVSNVDTTRIMAMVIMALVPSFLVSVYIFGLDMECFDAQKTDYRGS